jgi:Uma2 family endonuclease
MTPALPLAPPVIAPTEAEWRAMSPAEREALVIRVLDMLNDPRQAMTEGRRHKKAKTRTIDALGLHYRAIGRPIYLAEEMGVFYPGEEVFTPDVLAVAGVVEPEDDPRMAWVVADEGKGLDWVLEVLHHGDRNKDLVTNVERYARLGIPEYFVYDRLNQQIYGYHLPESGTRRYRRIVPQFGHHASAVLGLDLAIVGGKLRFFYGHAELPEAADLISRLNGIVADVEARSEEAQAQAAREQAAREEAQAQAAREQAAREEAQAQAAQAQAAQAQALEALRQGTLALLGARNIPCSDELKARLASCSDVSTLQRWLLKATSAATSEEVLAS